MGSPPMIVLIAWLAILAGFPTADAVAAPETESERLLYAVRLRGLRIGDVMISLDQSPAHYRSEMRARARGLAKLFNNFRAHLSGQGQVEGYEKAHLQPARYVRTWGARRWAAHLALSFDPVTGEAVPREHLFNPATGKEMKREDLPGRRRIPPPPVAVQDRFNVLDPMSAFITGRSMMRRHWRDGAQTPLVLRLPVYDGLRRYDIIIELGAVQDEKIGGVVHRVLPATTRMEPIGGFDAKMATRSREGKGRIVFSADDRFLPLQINMGNSLGRGVFTLIADCNATPAACGGFTPEPETAAP